MERVHFTRRKDVAVTRRFLNVASVTVLRKVHLPVPVSGTMLATIRCADHHLDLIAQNLKTNLQDLGFLPKDCMYAWGPRAAAYYVKIYGRKPACTKDMKQAWHVKDADRRR